MDDRWLSVDEIMVYLGVSRDTVYNWIARRGMPAHRVGRLWKFKKEAVDVWVESGGAHAHLPEPDGEAAGTGDEPKLGTARKKAGSPARRRKGR